MPSGYDTALGSYDYNYRSEGTGPSMAPTPGGGSAASGAALGGAAAAGPFAFAGVAAFQIWSGIQNAEMIRMQGQLQQRITDMNAKAAELDAYNAEKQGGSDVARYQTNIDQTVADQRAGYAAQDVDVNFGTAAQVQEETRLTGFLNKIDIQNQARARALGYTREARNIRMGGATGQANTEMQASAAQTQGFLNAAQTGVSGYARK